ncbi:hypothetical protein KR044_002797 [Drosophila immigrans]|nr:hypothetical protein KR044_002797 [Drosophila immigrans]
MENLLVGDKVIICRSDGRVHTAVVASKNEEEPYVTVFWREGTMTMGKEIPWTSILACNPHLEFSNQSHGDAMKLFESQQDDAKQNSSDNKFPQMETGSNGL